MDSRQPDALTESAIDGEIQGLLSVEPSPEFLARVRTSVVDAPIASPFSRCLPALGVVAALAVLVIVVAVSVSRTAVPEPVQVTAPPAPSPLAPARGELLLPPVVPTPLPRVTSLRRVSAPALATVASRTPEFPEVIMDPAVVRSLHDVVASVNARRFQVSPEGLQALMDTSIPEVVIAPVNVFVSDQGALQ